MKSYREWTKAKLQEEKQALEKKYRAYQGQNLALNMSRGRPCKEQLDLCMGMLDVVNAKSEVAAEDGTDCRNYGVTYGLPEAKRLMAEMMGTTPEHVIVCGNASLNIMYDMVAKSITSGVLGSTPWGKLDTVKFLCPVPGYDRHFALTEYLGIEMINIPMLPDGPDMDMVEKLAAEDESIKGIWCVPKYSNPQGITYSDETVRRFARLKPAAADFRIYWDNAYVIHGLYEEDDALLDIIAECEKAGNPDLVYEFASTSKVSFAGGGISAIAASAANIEDIKKQMSFSTIGYDKINQLRHVLFFKDGDGLKAHMKKHADILRPKFEYFLKRFDEEGLADLGAGSWGKPRGGYFIAYEAMPGCAKRIVALAKEAGVVMTGAGAPFPYGQDPQDSIIRIAPSLPPMEEIEEACKVFIICAKLATIEKVLENK